MRNSLSNFVRCTCSIVVALMLVLLIGAACSSMEGCQSAGESMVINAADTFVNQTVGPEYETYVLADPTLTESQKNLRHLNVKSFRDAVQSGKSAGGGLFGIGGSTNP